MCTCDDQAHPTTKQAAAHTLSSSKTQAGCGCFPLAFRKFTVFYLRSFARLCLLFWCSSLTFFVCVVRVVWLLFINLFRVRCFLWCFSVCFLLFCVSCGCSLFVSVFIVFALRCLACSLLFCLVGCLSNYCHVLFCLVMSWFPLLLFSYS